MKALLEQIRGRRNVTVEQMLMALEMVPAADTENRERLLGLAARGLKDPKIAGRWIELAAGEKDTGLRGRMLGLLSGLEARDIPDHAACIRLLVDCVEQQIARPTALVVLARLAGTPEAANALVGAYAKVRDRDAQRQILWALVQTEDVQKPLAEFFAEIIGRVDADVKYWLVDRLLRRDALQPRALAALLADSEPIHIRRRVLDHLVDRSIDVDDAVRHIAIKAADVGLRAAAVRALATRGKSSAETLLQVLRADPDAHVRDDAMAAFHHSLELTPDVVDALATALRTEKSAEMMRKILGLLTKHVRRSTKVRDAFVALARENLDATLAAELYAILGKLVAWDDALLDAFVRAYESERDDRVRAAILQSLSGAPPAHERLAPLYLAALKSPNKKIRDWGLAGLVLVPMSEDRCDFFAQAAPALNQHVDFELKLALARKIAKLPSKSKAVLSELKKAGEEPAGSDWPPAEDFKRVCETAYEEGAAATDDVDWDAWLHKIDVEKRSEGIFPELFLRYEQNPDTAKRILKAALHPDVNLYNAYGYAVNASVILRFLTAKRGVDDDISRYCVTFVLTKESNYGNPDEYLSILRSNPSFPTLRENLWQVLDRRPDVNPILMRELLRMAYKGDDDAVAKELRTRVLAKTNPGAAKPYLKFLAGNILWEPTESILEDVAGKAALVKDDARTILEEAFKQLHRPMPGKLKKPEGPGLLDE